MLLFTVLMSTFTKTSFLLYFPLGFPVDKINSLMTMYNTNRWMETCVDLFIDEVTDWVIDWAINGCMDGWMGWMDGWMD